LPKDNPFLGRRVLIIVSGGIAAYKTLDLIRRLREKGAAVRCVLTRAGAEFVTPLSLAALSEDKVYQSTFDLKDESEMGHVRLSREADILLVCPATANILAKMASGIADDLASTLLLATDKPVMVAPAMNVRMWDHAATRTNMETLKTRGVTTVGPLEGPMACNEFGVGRLAEPEDILAALADALRVPGPLNGLKALVTSGPTHEPIDPVRYIANRSSGKQGHAIARALRKLGAETTLVSGPTREPNPVGVRVIATETARQMLSRLRDGPARRHRRMRRRRGRLAGCRRIALEIEKGRVGANAGDRFRRKPRYPEDPVGTRRRPAKVGCRLCRRNRRYYRKRQGEARRERVRLDRRQRRFQRNPNPRRQRQSSLPGSRRRAGILAPHEQGRRGR